LHKKIIATVLPCALLCALCGAVTGAVIFFFKLLASKLAEYSHSLYTLAVASPLTVLLLLLGVLFLAALMILLHRFIPEVKGGGIPRSEGILRGRLSAKPLRTFLGTFLGSMISFFTGLPLGSEGPAVLIGTSVGQLTGDVSGRKYAWNRYVMTGGASAGFAAALGTPLSGLFFALEEIHKRFTPMLVIATSVSVLSATFVNESLSSLFHISSRLFHMEDLAAFKLADTGYLLLFGVIIALAVCVFDASISLFHKLTEKIKHHVRPWVKIVFLFLLSGVLGLFFAEGIYSGHDTVHEAMLSSSPTLFLVLILAVRFLMMLLVTDSGVTGGIFIPTLAIGALVSALSGKLLLTLGMPEENFSVLVLLGMCAFIGGTLRAPLTASVFFLELSGQFSTAFYAIVVIFIVNLITELLGQKSFYDSVLEDIEETQNKGKTAYVGFFEMKVSPDAFVVGKAVRDIMWPPSAVVVSILRAESVEGDTDNDGEKKLYGGDTVVIRTRFYDEEELRKVLLALMGNRAEIRRIESEKAAIL